LVNDESQTCPERSRSGEGLREDSTLAAPTHSRETEKDATGDVNGEPASALPPAIEELRRKLSGKSDSDCVAPGVHARGAGEDARPYTNNPDGIPTFATFK